MAIIKKALLSIILAFGFGLVFVPATCAAEAQPDASAYGAYSDAIVGIMERWTASRWGKDCFVWIVRYSDEMVDPWVEGEAIRAGMSDADKDAYRRAFVTDLQLDKSETFLVNIFSFGITPVDLTPVPDNFTLLSSSGARLRPTRYDSRFDSPITGLAQGLIFFPKQRDTNFALAIRGLGMSDNSERIFAFNNNGQYYEPATGEPVFEQEPEPEVVVVTLPKRQRERQDDGPKIIDPYIPAQPPVTPRQIPPLFADENTPPESSDMAAFVQSVRDRTPDNTNNASSNTEQQAQNGQAKQTNQDNNYVSRETVVRQFLSHWIENRATEMYEMLSSTSQKAISRENFAKEIARASDLRAAMREGYTLEWVGEERARVICYQRFLMFRSLLSRTLGITRENSSWKIVW